MQAIHQYLGEVEITEACEHMQAMNPDFEKTMFVVHDGETKEVTKRLVKIQRICSCGFKWYEGDDGRHKCLIKLK